MVTTENSIRLQEWWMDELRALTKKLIEQEEKRQAREKKNAEKKLGDYRTYTDIQEAYGVGVISARKRDQLYDLLEKSEPDTSELFEMKKNLLSEAYQTAKEVKASLEIAMKREREAAT